MKEILKKIPGAKAVHNIFTKIEIADTYSENSYHKETREKTIAELKKMPLRTNIINFLIQKFDNPLYLEIGVRHPEHNFNKIEAKNKYSVDPGYENPNNTADFKVTSDEFFAMLEKGEVLTKDTLFDMIFIDGSHLANQVDKDIANSLKYLKDDGFIVMHDCNPPTEFHASENFDYKIGPNSSFWNGTTWKAFAKARKRSDIYSCCVDTDWGVGIISKKVNFGAPSKIENEFYEYGTFDENRKETLNLVSYEKFKSFF